MAKSRNGLSHDLIIHPGETLKEVIENRGMSQRELAVRTGNSAKHISDVVNCLKPISVIFAKKLEYALGIEASFWINLQANYAKELADYEDLNHISDQEKLIVNRLKPLIEHFTNLGFLEKYSSKQSSVIQLRKLLSVSSLENIPDVAATGAYRVSESNLVDPYVLFAWLRMVELMADQLKRVHQLDVEQLMLKIPDIKRIMFDDASEIENKLQNLFASCGIKFLVVKHFKGAPVQGVITKTDNQEISLIMTIRQKFADVFWFTLIHEIGHIVHGDIKRRLIDYQDDESLIEKKADEFARNTLIDPKHYSAFLENSEITLDSIKKFAELNGVPPYIVIGRLQKEAIIEYSQFSQEKVRYEWD